MSSEHFVNDSVLSLKDASEPVHILLVGPPAKTLFLRSILGLQRMLVQGLTISKIHNMFAKFSDLRMEIVPHIEGELMLETIL
ncbi:MAG: hypothetical protein FIO04_04025 [Nitrosopumilales archaeon]|nr:hypothetical protein [Nitrosopumilales archaeon]